MSIGPGDHRHHDLGIWIQRTPGVGVLATCPTLLQWSARLSIKIACPCRCSFDAERKYEIKTTTVFYSMRKGGSAADCSLSRLFEVLGDTGKNKGQSEKDFFKPPDAFRLRLKCITPPGLGFKLMDAPVGVNLTPYKERHQRTSSISILAGRRLK